MQINQLGETQTKNPRFFLCLFTSDVVNDDFCFIFSDTGNLIENAIMALFEKASLVSYAVRDVSMTA